MKKRPFIVDGHLDLSMNAMEWNRDLRRPVAEIRTLEKDLTDKPDRGNNTVAFPEMRSGNIGMCFATLIARYAKPTHPLGGWRSPEQAWGMVQAQLAWYEEMILQGEMRMIRDGAQLEAHLTSWIAGGDRAIGFLLTLEGADSIISMNHLDRLHERGLRAIGPAHYGPGTYAYGTDSDGSIGQKGTALLNHMDRLGMVLDATHLSETSFWEALKVFKGPVWASHNNCRALVDHNRQFSDEQLLALIERGAVIGVPLDAWMMVPNWVRAQSHPSNTGVTLANMIDHMDHICQLAGNTRHVALGTDLDGGFGTEQGPSDLNTIDDLQQLVGMLTARGYSGEDVEGIFSGNWLGVLRAVLS
jgi:membrane dipeptidase